MRASLTLDNNPLVKDSPTIILTHPCLMVLCSVSQCLTALHDTLRSRLILSRLRWVIVARKLNTRHTLPGQVFAGDKLHVPVLHDTFMPHGASVLHNYPRSRLRSSRLRWGIIHGIFIPKTQTSQKRKYSETNGFALERWYDSRILDSA